MCLVFNTKIINNQLTFNYNIFDYIEYGGVAERFKAPVLKTDVGQLTVGSNPTPSAIWKNIWNGVIKKYFYQNIIHFWKIISCIVPESSVQLKILIYYNHKSINLQKKLWEMQCEFTHRFYTNVSELRTTIRLQACSNFCKTSLKNSINKCI